MYFHYYFSFFVVVVVIVCFCPVDFNAGGPCVEYISVVLFRLVLLVKEAVETTADLLPLCYLLFSTWSVFF